MITVCLFPSKWRMEEGMTSSRYGLYKLGYTFATMGIEEIRFYLEITVSSVQLAFCNLKA